MVDESSTPDPLKRFFSNPVVGVIGWIASVVSIPLAVYFYFAKQEYRDLRYLVNPARAVIFQPGQTSRLSITFDGEPVNRDVSAVQVAFWNEGRKSIRRENVLRPLVIRTGPQFPILEAEVRKRSREVVKVAVNASRMERGEIEVDWNILEYHDGAIIQLVYFGDAQVPVTASSTIEGQGGIEEIKYSRRHIPPPIQRYGEAVKISDNLRVAFVIAAVCAVAFALYAVTWLKRHDIRLVGPLWLLFIVVPATMVVMALLLLFGQLEPPGPPFGF